MEFIIDIAVDFYDLWKIRVIGCKECDFSMTGFNSGRKRIWSECKLRVLYPVDGAFTGT